MNTRTHITIVVDRSGSMNSVRSDAEGAVNAFIQEQQALPDDGTSTLLVVDFDDKDPHRIAYDGPLSNAPSDCYRLTPRGMTPLRDAIGKAIVATGERLEAMPEADRPSTVFLVIQTDGLENASHEFGQEMLVGMIRHQEEVYSWTFLFLAAGPDAWQSSEMFRGTTMHATTIRSTGDAGSYAHGYGAMGQTVTTRRLNPTP